MAEKKGGAAKSGMGEHKDGDAGAPKPEDFSDETSSSKSKKRKVLTCCTLSLFLSSRFPRVLASIAAG